MIDDDVIAAPTPEVEATNFDDAPGVRWAYEFVLPSYDWAIRRFDSANERLQSLIVFASGLTVGVPTLAKATIPEIGFASFWFLAAVVAFLGVFIVALLARNAGDLQLVDPLVLASDFFWDDEFTFKKDMVYFAGDHLDQNTTTVENKAAWLTVASVLLLVEMVLLVTWLASS